MKKERYILLCWLILFVASCNSTPVREYLDAPDIIPTINANCTGLRDGKFVDATNNLSVDTQDYDTLMSYVADIEKRLYICLKFKSKCK